ncbi:MAG: septum formation inhibitor Maf [Geodermatophilaceae bacterium]|nr:septum formation inhibitor Maf [Geodermatophilaceae bacterium]
MHVPPRLVLASASSGRLRLLRQAGFDPQVMVSGVDESTFAAAEPADLVRELALAKANAVAATVSDGLIVGADSVLDLDGTVLGKPKDSEEARHRWDGLAGRSGVLRTGQAVLLVVNGSIKATDVVAAATTVHFGRPDQVDLDAYLQSGEPMQVAGAFTIDGLGGQFVDSIDGDIGTVIGLSLPLLRAQAARLGIRLTDLWA